LYPDCTVVPFPLDFSRAVRCYLDHFAPALVVFLELELWPNFLLAASNRDIPVILVNGRLSEKSYRGYARYLRGIFPVMVANVRRFAMQNETYAERLIRLGIARERVTVTGNMKFDVAVEVAPEARQALRRQCGLASDHLILVGGSTHAPEEKMLIASYRALLPEFPGLRLILVPRQPRRDAEIGQWIREHGFNVIYRSELSACERNPLAASDVIVGDLMGELVNLYGIAGIAIIGGSLVADGGHNFIEPAALGKAVICGPSMFHFQEAEEFARQGALLQLASADELESALRQLLRSDEKRTGLGVAARRIVEANRGTARRNAALCMDMLRTGLGTSGRTEIAES
jgi:3-deoxy-D-manno-octulosonic-acid transferase